MFNRIALLFALVTLCLASSAQQVPSPASFLGYEIGEQFTPHWRIVQYFEALQKAAPQQVKIVPYGKTYEGRPLMVVLISSASNIQQAETIRMQNLQAVEGEGNGPGKAIVWMSYNVHGNEASSSEAVMKTAHALLTETRARQWLDNTVVILDPCINPDGRDRYVNWFNSVAGRTYDPHPAAREHMEPWPGGRSNHYNFDLNRDWAWQTQIETQQRIKLYHEWMPHIHVDFHEQGYNEPYYFAPAAEPLHDVITPFQREFQNRIGRNHAKYFDANGWLYFTKERFDLFYPSYGDTWPTYNGGIGMTYEQGGHSRGGLGIINEDGDTLTLTDRANHHFTTGMSTVEIASANAAELAKNFGKFFDDARKTGSGEYKSYVIKTKGNEWKMKSLVQLLERNKIKYAYAAAGNSRGFNYVNGKEESFSTEGTDIVIPANQSRGALVQVLFEPNGKLNDSATYDITAWAVPYAYGLNAFATRDAIRTTTTAPAAAAVQAFTPGAYGYVKNWKGLDDARFLAACLKRRIKVRVSEKPFTLNGKNYEAGSLILLKTSNQHIANLDSEIGNIVRQLNTSVDAVKTGFVDKGGDFGSPDIKTIQAPRIAMLTGDGVSSLGAGQLWFFFDHELEYPVTLINTRDAAGTDWRGFDILVMPSGFNYRGLLTKEGPLQRWIEQGGKLIAIENAVNQIAAADWGLANKKVDEKKPEGYALLRTYANRERDNLVDFNPGSIYRVQLDNTHPLAFGYGKEYYTLKGDDTVFEFLNNGWNVGVIKKDAQVAGFTGSRAKERLKDGLVFGELPMGRGSVVLMGDDVLFRNFWENGKLLFANALFMVNAGGSFHL